MRGKVVTHFVKGNLTVPDLSRLPCPCWARACLEGGSPAPSQAPHEATRPGAARSGAAVRTRSRTKERHVDCARFSCFLYRKAGTSNVGRKAAGGIVLSPDRVPRSAPH